MIDVNLNKAVEVVGKARKKGVILFWDDEKIKFKTRKNEGIEPELLEEIKKYRDEIKTLLNNNEFLSREDIHEKILPASRDSIIPLSSSQERLWFIDQMEGSVKYHIPVVLKMKGALNRDALAYALQQIVNRHEVLRTVIEETRGVARQRVGEKDCWQLDVIIHDHPQEGLIQSLIDAPFDLSADHMLRASLIVQGNEEYVLVVTMHHIAADGWSTGIIVRELTALYSARVQGHSPQLPVLEIQYADYAVWQRKYLSGKVLEEQLQYWNDKLSDTAALELPLDHPRPVIQSTRGAIASFRLDRRLSDQLKALSLQQGTTLFMTLLAVFKVLLYRYTGQEDICVGTPVAGRTRKEVDQLIGFFINTLALRSDLSQQPSFAGLLQQVKKTTLEAYDHQELPFEKVVETVVKERDLSRNPLFQVMFVLQNTPGSPDLELNGVTFSHIDTGHTTAKFDLTCSMEESSTGITGRMEYCTDLFSAATINRMIQHFEQLLQSVVKTPAAKISALSMLTAEEATLVIKTFNDTSVAYPANKSIIALFTEQVNAHPEAIAVRFGEDTLTYAALHESSSQLAHYLQSKGVGNESLVPLCMERSLEMMTGILAILKAGGAYVPLDPAYPEERISFMLAECNSDLLLTTTSYRDRFINRQLIFLDQLPALLSGQPVDEIPVQQKADDLAYVIYTSGSTGKPKGVMVTHRNVVSLATGGDFVSLNREDILLSTGSLSFDATTIEYWGMLLNGGQLILCPQHHLLDNILLKQEISKWQVTKMWFTSSWFNQLVDDDITLFEGLTAVMVGGEKLSEEHIRRFRNAWPEVAVINGYGPTENTTFSLTYLIKDIGRSIPIGRPLGNRTAYVLDTMQNPVPVGIAGELYVGGAGVSRGYLNQPELTAGKFIPDPYAPGEKLYRTGDRARWLPDGNVEYLGRIDDQVKIRGYRIEPGEIESVLLGCELVTQAVVIAQKVSKGHNRLIGYIVPNGVFNREGIVTYLRAQLPEYMVPALLIEMEKLPVTTNGKIDKKALPEPEEMALQTNEFIAPRNRTEQTIADIWKELLGIERIGIYDNFFELGGDSIITIQVVSRARRAGYELHPRDLFLHQTIERLALQLSTQREQTITGEQGLLTGSSGLLPIQQWFFETNEAAGSYFNQSVLMGIDKGIEASLLNTAIIRLVQYHDALRFVYHRDDQGWTQYYGQQQVNLAVVDAAENLNDTIEAYCQEAHRSLDITKGILIHAALILTGESETHNRLLIVVHHLAVDGVSWRILLEDLELLLKREGVLSPKGSSYRQWYEALSAYANRRVLKAQQPYWERVVTAAREVPLRVDKNYEGRIAVADIHSHEVRLDSVLTHRLLQEVPKAYHTEINDILLCALALTFPGVCIGLEGHGRENIAEGIDTSRTVGWFTNLYPVLLEVEKDKQPGEWLKSIKEQLRAMPDKGIGYGILKYIAKVPSLQGTDPWDIVFNYLGQSDNVVDHQGALSLVTESSGSGLGEAYAMQEKLSVNSIIRDGELVVIWSYSSKHYDAPAIIALGDNYLSNLEMLITHCVSQTISSSTPSDYGLRGALTVEELDKFLDTPWQESTRRAHVTGLYPLSGLQGGMLFHGLYDDASAAYIEQFGCDLLSLNIDAFKDAWAYLFKRHSIFRTAFYSDEAGIPLQCVYDEMPLPLTILNYGDIGVDVQEQAVQEYTLKDSRLGFDFKKAPLMRITLIRLRNERYRMLWTFHHILFDGWSIPVLVEELLRAYESRVTGKVIREGNEDRYEDYIRYLERQDKEQEELYWRGYLSGVEEGTLLPFIKAGADRTKGAGEYSNRVLELDASVTAKITRYAQQEHITVNTLMQGVWAYLLYRYTGRTDITFGVTVSGRPEDLPGIEQRVGLYINTLPFHAKVDEDKQTNGWLKELQAAQLQSREYQYMALDVIQRWTGISGDLFDTLLVFENYPVSKVISSQSWQLQIDNVAVHEQTNYPLGIMIGASTEINIRFSYNNKMLSADYVEAIAGHFEKVLFQIAGNEAATLKDIAWLTTQEQQQLLETFNDTAVAYPANKTLTDLFTEQVFRTPDAIATVFEASVLTYRQLDERAGQLANYLRSRGVTNETLVPICIERSLDMIIGILGILKAGAAYVPIDPAYPKERISYMLSDTAAGLILSDSRSAAGLPETTADVIRLDDEADIINGYPVTVLETTIRPDHLAYVIYTSGSTGTPKGVMNEHAGVVNRLLWTQSYFKLKSTDVVLQKTTFCFDVSVWELLWPLITGAKLVFALPDGQKDTDYLKGAIDHYGITTMHFVPSMLNVFLESISAGDCASLLRVLCSGEALKPQQVMDFREKLPVAEIYNLYGPTEAAIDVTYWHGSRDITYVDVVPIGKPVANTQLYILDKSGNILPPGVSGELHIGGVQVARGYLNRAVLTAEKFVPDPFSAKAGARMYRTGDLCRWLPDGNIEYAGRIDDQVKIRGYRIELGEIESVLLECEWVSEAVVLAKTTPDGNKQLVGYVVPAGDFDREAIISYLKGKLPEYMVPALLTELSAIPLTSNGKVDRKALPDPDAGALLMNIYVAPRNETEQALTAIWQDLLNVKKVGVYDDFFNLGGNSLLSMRLVSALRKNLQVEVSVKSIFIHSTVASLAAYILQRESAGLALPPVEAHPRPEQIPLSFSQERLWFIDQLEGSVQYHIPSVLRLKGTLDKAALAYALQSIVNRHEVLRTIIEQEDGKAWQRILDKDHWQLQVVNAPAYKEDPLVLSSLVKSLISAPFNLSADHMLRAHLIELGEEEHILVVVLHHIAADGWSTGIIVKELVALYEAYINNNPALLPALPLQYADYAIWQRQYLSDMVLSVQLEYWKEKLNGVEVLQLPADRTRPAVQSTRGAVSWFRFDKKLSDQLKVLSQQQGATLFMTLLAAFKVLLYRYSGQEDICVGSPTAGRTRQETEGLIGFFINTLALRSHLAADQPFAALLQQVKETTLSAYDHQEIPFEKIVEAVIKERDLSRSPLFQVMFVLQNMPATPDLNLGNLHLSGEAIDYTTTQYDLSFSIQEDADGLSGNVEYCVDVFSGDTIARMTGHFEQLLRAIVKSPAVAINSLPMLSFAEEQQLLKTFNDTQAPRTDKTLISLFTEQAGRTPQATALVFENTALTYQELDERSGQLAAYLNSKGVKTASLVPLCLERSLDMIVAILGILKAGGAYVPLDPEHPAERISFVLDDCGMDNVVITTTAYRHLINRKEVICLDECREELLQQPFHRIDNAAADPAYVIYTSGSTGKPKGVIIRNESVVNFICNRSRDFGIDASDRVLQFSNYCFDAAVEQMFLPLVNGAALVMIPEALRLDKLLFEQLMERERITHLDTTPGFLSTMTPGKYGGLKRVISGGEACSLQLAKAWGEHVDFYNEYGPTEATIVATGYLFSPEDINKRDILPIGKPLTNVQVYVLDTSRQLLPVGVAGELYIGGVQVAGGYLNLPVLTAEKFVNDPFSDEAEARLYKTGDLARWLPDGNIEYLGRIDDQVKIRGYRIELGEIENVLLQYEEVSEAVVLVKADANGTKRLVGYVVSHHTFDREGIIAFLRERLPEYMVPSMLIALPALPLTSNGKVDKKALPDPDPSALLTNIYAAPGNTKEQVLADIWQELLGIERIGIYDNFFELGGDSITTIQVVSRARRAGYELHPADLFKYQTIAGLSALLSSQQESAMLSGEQGILKGTSGLLPIQQWYFETSHTKDVHFNQAVLLGIDKRVEVAELSAAIAALVRYHDALRFVYNRTGNEWTQVYGIHEGALEVADLRSVAEDELGDRITALNDNYQQGLYIEQGVLIRTVLLLTPAAEERNRLLLVVHHLAVDGVSWRILLEDLELLLKNDGHKKADELLGAKSSSYRQWYEALSTYGQHKRLLAQRGYWEQVKKSYVPLRVDKPYEEQITISDTRNHVVRLDALQTQRLLQEVPRIYHTEINDILLCTLALTLSEWSNTDKVVIGLEGHGREAIANGIDTSHTVGWFTNLYPVLLDVAGKRDGALLKSVKEQLRKVTDKGIGYGVLKYINKADFLQGKDPWDIVFNYLGQSGNIVAREGLLSIASESPGASIGADFPVMEKIAVDSLIQDSELVLRWKYSSKHYEAAGIEKLATAYLYHLQELITHCISQPAVSFTPSDYGLGKEVDLEELETFLDAPYRGTPRRLQIDGLYKLSGLQEGMLFHGLYDDQTGAYIEQFGCDLLHLQEEAFLQSWNMLLQRHSVLRTGFYYDDFSIPVQCVYRDVQMPVTILDYRNMNEEALKEYEAADRIKGFDFKEVPLMRLTLIQLEDNRHRMLWTSHHILFDGWSLPVLLEGLLRTYESLVTATTLPEVQEDRYEPYIRYLEYRDKEQEERYWRKYLEGVTESTLLPFIGSTAERTRGAGIYKQERLVLDASATGRIARFAQRHRITQNTLMQGVWSYLLYRYTGRKDVTYGITVSGRPENLPGVEQAVGMYINTLPLHAKISEEKEVVAWLQELQASQLESREYQYTPLDMMQRWTGISGDWFDSLLVFENYPVTKVLAAQQWHLQVDNVSVHEQTNLPLEILVTASDTISITFKYNADILDEAYVQIIKGHFEQILRQMTGRDTGTLNTLELLTREERHQIVYKFNNKEIDYPQDKTLVDLFHSQATCMPGATALIFEGKSMTYQQLDDRSSQLAHYLQSLGVKADTLVPVCIERSLEMIIGILGIMKAGGAYVPVDTEYPAERIGYILDDINAKVVVSSSRIKPKIAEARDIRVIALDDTSELLHRQPVLSPAILPAPNDLAYVIYTSGSTGKPKGVLIEHRGMLNHLYGKINDLSIDQRSVIAYTASYTFDISVWQMFAALICGGTTVIYNDELIFNPGKLIKSIDQEQVTILELVPSYLAAVLQEDINIPLQHLKFLLVTGETVSQQLLARWFGHPYYKTIPVVNAYGPTEASDDICHYFMYETPVQTNIPLGSPVQNLHIYITDESMHLCPVGVPGEICVSGVGVGRGYLNRPELTAEKFIADPFTEEEEVRMYRTGDLGRWLPDGNIEYLGRIDDQVKVRGYRIELGEIEHALQQHESIHQAVVVARADLRGNKHLVGYIVPAETFGRDVVNTYLKELLPEYMIPSVLITLEKLPLTPNGKIDKKALPDPDAQGLSSQSYVAPRNETEQLLAEIWQELLDVKAAGIYDNFFELGGNSLQVIRLTSSIRKKFQVEIAVRTFFQLATIESLARYIKLNQKGIEVDQEDLQTIRL
ncbi:amino acid adenylation domain-containing protein [Chitinophaga oryziterrae]|uniref:Amino acid adenylation domain-containing protein n=1 Tax=Chitinophaga oryziterrae TaxID=1031224 RepID=A0A6N8J8K9_9BACT|nr:non-ribosomal peptide synthase/polyketide synthase [Chitinophaga oryziterrae]MVT41615.1 amino acid adenylation domain-containing protein [Chitinophaga oryziterrae]